jgi:hypothetical protein
MNSPRLITIGRRPAIMADQRAQPTRAEWGAGLLDAVIAHDDDMGHLANATADELRDALRVAATRLRTRRDRTERDPLIRGARWLVAEVWQLVDQHTLNARSMAADAALDLRDTIDTGWLPVAEEERPHARR